jgi:putative tryptophan/tyrosine transport system substrate-binding protein
MMNRRMFLWGLTLGALAKPLAVEGQQAGKAYRVAIVVGTSPSPTWHPVNAFQQTLRGLGYVEGRNLVLDQRFTEGRPDRFPNLIAEVLRLNPDVLVVGSSAGALAAKSATATVPVVFVGAADPVGQGIVASLARPGGNVTGNSLAFEGFAAKWGQLIKEAVPHVSRIAAIWNPKAASKFGPIVVKEVEGSTRALGVRLDVFEVRAISDIDRAFSAIKASGAGGLIVTPDPLFFSTRARFVELAAQSKVPAIYFFRDFVDDGGLMAYGPSLADSYRRGALYVDKILKGAKPGDLPVEQPTKFELVINLKTAKALGLTIPPSLLLRADQVIE